MHAYASWWTHFSRFAAFIINLFQLFCIYFNSFALPLYSRLFFYDAKKLFCCCRFSTYFCVIENFREIVVPVLGVKRKLFPVCCVVSVVVATAAIVVFISWQSVFAFSIEATLSLSRRKSWIEFGWDHFATVKAISFQNQRIQRRFSCRMEKRIQFCFLLVQLFFLLFATFPKFLFHFHFLSFFAISFVWHWFSCLAFAFRCRKCKILSLDARFVFSVCFTWAQPLSLCLCLCVCLCVCGQMVDCVVCSV